jgi:hypothetical protein
MVVREHDELAVIVFAMLEPWQQLRDQVGDAIRGDSDKHYLPTLPTLHAPYPIAGDHRRRDH